MVAVSSMATMSGRGVITSFTCVSPKSITDFRSRRGSAGGPSHETISDVSGAISCAATMNPGRSNLLFLNSKVYVPDYGFGRPTTAYTGSPLEIPAAPLALKVFEALL